MSLDWSMVSAVASVFVGGGLLVDRAMGHGKLVGKVNEHSDQIKSVMESQKEETAKREKVAEDVGEIDSRLHAVESTCILRHGNGRVYQ